MKGFITLLLASGCVSGIGNEKSHNSTDETQGITDPGWSTGISSDCNFDGNHIAYDDKSHLLDATAHHFDGMTIEGAIAVQPDANDWIIWQLAPPDTIVGIGLNSGEEYIRTPTAPPSRFIVDDFDNNGIDDMLVFGEFIDVFWGVATADVQFRNLLHLEHGRGIRDLGVIDADGDGDMDLWVFVGETADAPQRPPPPSENCTGNSIGFEAYGNSLNLNQFLWDLDGNSNITVVGYPTSNDVCGNLNQDAPLNHTQLTLNGNVDLGQAFPQTLAIGPNQDLNLSFLNPQLMLQGDPAGQLDADTGSLKLNQVQPGQELNIENVSSNGPFIDQASTTVAATLSGNTISACYCPGLADYYGQFADDDNNGSGDDPNQNLQVNAYGLLYENTDDGFVLAGELATSDVWGAPFDGLVMDWDDDGDPDIYVCHDFGFLYGPNALLINDGTGVFTQGDAAGADIETACMGSSAGDFNGDGELDLYITSTGNQHMLINNENGYYDAAASLNFPTADPAQMLWGGQIVDYNNDGRPDAAAATSEFSRQDSSGSWVVDQRYPIWLMEQKEDGSVEEVGSHLGFAQSTMSRAIASIDLNHDGVTDFIVSDAERHAWLYMSASCTQNRWLKIEGPTGSKVTVTAGTQSWTAFITADPGMAASMPPIVHIGLGEVDVVDSIVMDVPWLGEQRLSGPIQSNQTLKWSP